MWVLITISITNKQDPDTATVESNCLKVSSRSKIIDVRLVTTDDESVIEGSPPHAVAYKLEVLYLIMLYFWPIQSNFTQPVDDDEIEKQTEPEQTADKEPQTSILDAEDDRRNSAGILLGKSSRKRLRRDLDLKPDDESTESR